MKKFTFHLDMIIVVIVLFGLCVAGNLYQRKIHGELTKEYIALKLHSSNIEISLIETKGALKTCENGSDIQTESADRDDT